VRAYSTRVAGIMRRLLRSVYKFIFTAITAATIDLLSFFVLRVKSKGKIKASHAKPSQVDLYRCRHGGHRHGGPCEGYLVKKLNDYEASKIQVWNVYAYMRSSAALLMCASRSCASRSCDVAHAHAHAPYAITIMHSCEI
jgi:hypothetical protein